MSTIPSRTSAATAAPARSGFDRGVVLRLFWWSMRVLERAVDCVLTWQERARGRRHLEALSDHMLRDIGLSRADVMAEATKPFWQR